MTITEKLKMDYPDPINRYEVVYGNLFVCKRIVFALSENDVYDHCQKKWPNIFPLKEINLLEENIDMNDYLTTT